jgi:hypothetical protein
MLSHPSQVSVIVIDELLHQRTVLRATFSGTGSAGAAAPVMLRL